MLEPIKCQIYSEFSNILINKHIGYIKEIEEEYKQVKHKLKQGYPNIVLYAYCTYNILLKDGVYYSLNQISNLFQINNFCKYYCQIERNHIIKKHNFDIMDDKYVYSALTLFLSKFCLHSYMNKAVKISKLFKRYYSRMKLNCHLSLTLYFTLKPIFKCEQELLKTLSLYHSLNMRTLNKTIKYAKCNLKNSLICFEKIK